MNVDVVGTWRTLQNIISFVRYLFILVHLQHFDEFVASHFRKRAVAILSACKLYVEGSDVGSVGQNSNQSSNITTENKKTEFQTAVSRVMNTLIAFFTKNGSTDCDIFRSPEIYDLSALANLHTSMEGGAQQQQENMVWSSWDIFVGSEVWSGLILLFVAISMNQSMTFVTVSNNL